MAYVAESVPSTELKTALDTYWENRDGQLPKPKIMEHNVDPDNVGQIIIGWNPSRNDYVIIRSDVAGEREKLRGIGASYKDRTFDVLVDLYTVVSKQRLHDMKAEIRRIIHKRIHDFSWDLVIYQGFTENAQANLNFHSGSVRVRFQSDREILDT